MIIAKKIEIAVPVNLIRKMYITMSKIRMFEEKVGDLVSQKEIISPCHLYIGQEAVATGVCAALGKDDYVFSTHRSHGHYLAKGGDMKQLMAELFCRATGCSHGKGGSMHVVSPEVGFLGSSAIVGGNIPLAVGVALGASLQNKNNVCVTFFGDGATDEGVFYESLNFASLKKLPVIFVCENNLYSTHMPISKCLADTNIYKKAEIFNMPGYRIDGNNVIEVFKATERAIEFARNGEGPTLLECLTYRWRGHVGPNLDLDKGLRSKEELESWMNKCPIKGLEVFLLEQGIISETGKIEIRSQMQEEIDEAVRFAKESPFPDRSELTKNVFKSEGFK